MSEKVLNEARTSELWSKVKEYVTEHGGSGSSDVSPGGGITNWSDISTIMHTVILRADSWDEDGIQTVSVLGVVANEAMQLIQPMPFTASQSLYYACNINCVSQTTDSLTFKATTIPQNDLTIYVAVINVQAIYGDNGNVPVLAHEWWSPEMTSDATPVPYIATSSEIYRNQGFAYSTFGKREGDYQFVQLATSEEDVYVQIYLQNLLSIGGFRIYTPMTGDYAILKGPIKQFSFYGSNDGILWTKLKTILDLSSSVWKANTAVEFMLDSIATFKYYKLANLVTSDTSAYVSVGVIEFYI